MVRDGLVVVDKPAGWTSHDVVAKLRGIYGQKRVGHAGTLDPDATGVLLVGLGPRDPVAAIPAGGGEDLPGAGRVRRRHRHARRVGCGARARGDALHARAARARGARRSSATSKQVPPMVSAIKVGGRKLYELARAGEEIERAPRPVRIDALVVEDFEAGAVSGGDVARRVLERHVHPLACRRPRQRARRLRAPRGAAPAARGAVHARRGAHDRRDRGRPGRGVA